MTPENLVFFLGGRDLEMRTIRGLLQDQGCSFHDLELCWGARASDYRPQIEAARHQGQTAVLVELEDDMRLSGKERVIVVDHHRETSGSERPTSLEQVFHLLGLPEARWTRRLELVAANDRGYIPEMEAVGASLPEIREIRDADRRAQGITSREEQQARQAIRQAESLEEGLLTVIELAHDHTAPACDFLHPAYGGPGFRNLAIFSPGEVNVFGQGKVIRSLIDAFPHGWYGGALPESGFWGDRRESLDRETVLTVIRQSLGGRS